MVNARQPRAPRCPLPNTLIPSVHMLEGYGHARDPRGKTGPPRGFR